MTNNVSCVYLKGKNCQHPKAQKFEGSDKRCLLIHFPKVKCLFKADK